MREGKLLPFDERAIYYLLTDSKQKIITIMREGKLLPNDRFQNYNYVRGQFTIYYFWQIPAKKNNYNYVKGQFTSK